MNELTIELVNKNGKIDHDASLAVFETEYASYIAQHETEVATLSAAVDSILDAHPGKSIAMPVLASMALNSINVQPENFSALEELTLQYMRDNSKGEDSLFVITKGKGGGLKRRV
jgi:hypothetical protein